MIKVGTGIASLQFDDGHGLFGYGPLGGRGLNVPHDSKESDTLQVRVLYLVRDTQKLLIVSLDLTSGSRVVQAELRDALAEAGHHFAPEEVLVVGTHTHSGPGGYHGNFYDYFGQYPSFRGAEVKREIVAKALHASLNALSNTVPCKVGVAHRAVWGPGRNRSLRAFLTNFEGDLTRWNAELESAGIAGLPPATTTPEQRAIDPRLTVVAFVAADGRTVATWATWCCHAATFRRAPERPYHRDWPGVAVDLVERSKEAGFAIVHQRSNGDVTAIPSGDISVPEPVDRARAIGAAIAEQWLEALGAAVAKATPEAAFEVHFHDFAPKESGLPTFEIGEPVLVGSEEYDPPGIVTRSFLGESRTLSFRKGAQGVKFPALGPLQWALRVLPALKPSPKHPMWLLRLDDHLFFASPFEQTTYAARTVEKALVAKWKKARGGSVTASPVGLVGDYAGYLTTPSEYANQNYEGAHTLYGPTQLETMIGKWAGLIKE
ncbi:hypothetical protein BH09MYX1_BH09MYX1_07270 [soil metagenome]